MKLYWSDIRQDNFTTATADGEHDSVIAGYRFIRTEGYCLPEEAPGTAPLQLFYNGVREDNFVTATEQGAKDAYGAGYSLIRTEGYVYAQQQPGTVPLKLFYNDVRGDNFTTATQQGADAAVAAGYTLIRTEGYVHPEPPGGLKVAFPLTAHHEWRQSAMHMDADAVLTEDGQLRATTHTWSTWMLKGFTGGCMVMVVDDHENVIHHWVIHPLGVDGTWIGQSRRVDVNTQQVDNAIVERAVRLELICSHMGKNRLSQIIEEAQRRIEEILRLAAAMKA